jgi:hypothetical protein
MNWLCLLADVRLKKQKIDRHISMGPTFGVCLALGFCLLRRSVGTLAGFGCSIRQP